VPWTGEEPLGELGADGARVLAAALRSTPEVLEGGRLPHPTDRAVIHAGDDTGIRSTTGTEAWERLDELPFEPVRAFHATRGRVGDGVLLSVKGAPEVVLPQCTHRQGVKGRVKLGAAAHRTLEARVDDLARRGLRVLAVAERSLPAGAADGPLQEAAVAGLTFVGLLGLSDPVRPTAAAAVEGVRRAGVEVIMITGDHPTTAEGIAAELDLLDDTVVLTGPEIDELEDDDLADRLAGTTVCARVTPTHKVRIVRALQHRGRTVAMTGDGSNDAPAIRLADVGIALGTRATTAARNAADVVVSDDRVETIVDAIGEGRTLWASVRDAAAVLVGGNLGEIGFTLGAALLQGGPPLNARQLLLVNMLTDALPAMAIAVRPPADHTVESLLREGPDRSLGEALNRAIAVRAIATASGAFAAWGAAKVTGRPARASSVALVALVGAQLGQTIATGGRSPFVLGAGIGSAAVLAAIVQTPGVSQLFGCTPLGPVGWGIGLSAAAAATAGSVVLPSVLDDRVLAWLDRVGLAELPASPVPGAGTDPAPAWLVRPT
jgi:cation-transporting ATPase I